MQSGEKNGLRPYLSVWAVLALSFGYAVGWGAFVMPGRVFLPNAGPLGTVIGIAIGALAMCIFALNYHRMVLREPGPGGAYRFTRQMFGADHGFFVSWFLCLTYIAILWANATSVILFARYLGGDALQFGFHYMLVGFDVYFGEVMLCVLVIVAVGVVSLLSRRLVAHLQMLLALWCILGFLAYRRAFLLDCEDRFGHTPVVRAIRADPAIASIPVYVMTADVDMRDTFANIGFAGLLLKPVTIESLREVLGL